MKQARLDLEDAILAAGKDPTDAKLRSVLLRYVTPERFTALDQFISELERDGLLVRENPDIPARVTFVSEVVLPVGPNSTEAFVDACRVNSSIVYQPLDGGGEVIIDDSVMTTLSRLRLILFEGRWILESSDRIGSWPGEATCEG